MGVFRKLTSISTLGLVDLRSDKERIAKNTKLGYKAQQDANALAARQLATQQAALAEAQASSRTPAARPGEISVVEELKGLAQLRDSGVLTEAEFETQKARLLSGI